MNRFKRTFGFIALAFAIAGIISSCASVSDCPAYGASKKGTYHGYNSASYRR